MKKSLLRVLVLIAVCMPGWGVVANVITSNSAILQDKYTLKGTVLSDEDNSGLPGVTILVKGSTTGTVTDLDGKFSISVGSDDILIFSFVGFKTVEVPVNGKTQLDVTMQLDIESLEEVVVVGYGEQKKANLTGAVLSVDTRDLDEIPTGNLSETLIGKMAGVQVNRNGTGIPGTPIRMVIRNETASGLQRQVLYVIDGVIYSSNDFYATPGPSGAEIFNRLDPSEIESISILKDGAAAVYGARAAGGVVVVKTKRGQPGKLKFTYNGSTGIGQPTQIPDMLTGLEHATLWNEIVDISRTEETGKSPIRRATFDEDELALIAQRDYDWLDGLYKDAYNMRHAFTASGGSESVTYFVAGNFYKETGNYDNLWYKKYSVRTNLEAEVTKDLVFGLGINYSQGNRKNPNFDPGSSVQEGVLREWYKRPLTASRWVPPVIDGNPVDNGSWNPYGLQESDNYRTSSDDNANLNARLEYKAPFLKGLKFSGMISYNINSGYSTRYGQDYPTYKYFDDLDGITPADTALDYKSNSEGLEEQFSRSKMYQFNFGPSYNRTFGKHNIGGTLLYEQQNGDTRGFGARKEIADIRGFDYFWAFKNGANTISHNYTIGGRWSFIGRFNYDYDGKYLFESSFRAESSNKFAPDERFGIFPHVSVGWVISEEGFFKNNIDFINFLKIRSSYGLTGNDGNSALAEWKPTFNAGQTGAIFGRNEVLSNAIVAKNNGFFVESRTWAKSRNFNVGMDISLFERKLDITTEYYYVLIYDAFDRPQDIPFVIGNPKPLFENHKESYSKGYEFQLQHKNDLGKDIKYSLYANFSRRESRPTKLYQNPLVVGTWVDQLKNADSNQPGFVALGIIRDEEHLEAVKQMYPGNMNDDGDVIIDGITLAPGMIYYKDLGGPDYSREPDGRLDGNDRTIIAKYTTPPYSYGFGLSFGWRSWKVNAAFAGVFGHKDFIAKDEQVVNTDTDLVAEMDQNTFAWWGDYWTEENQDASMPRPYAYGKDGEHSTFWMRDGHTLRLNNVSLAYSVPKRYAQKMRLSNVKVYASATNLWTIVSPFDFKDPAVSRAFDYPLVRMVNMGLSFSM